MASTMVVNSLSIEIQKDFKHMVKDVPGLWIAIKDKYFRQSAVAKTVLMQSLIKEKLKEGESVDTYVSRLRDTIRRLEALDTTTDSDMQKFYLVEGLTDSYQYIKDKMRTNSSDFTFDDIVKQMQDKYDELVRQKERGADEREEKSVAKLAREERAAFVGGAGPFRGRGRGRGGFRSSPYGGRGGRGGGRGGYRGVSRGGGRGGYSGHRGGSGGVGGERSNNIVCYNCGKTGHIKSNCTEKVEKGAGGKCFVCHKTGHLAAQCRHKGRQGGEVRSFGDNKEEEE